MNEKLSTPPALARPTGVRYGVLAFACTLSMITYLDRVCFAYAATPLRDVLGLNSVADLSLAFSAFAFAYAAFEIPSGWLGDAFGPRNVLIRIVLWWSVFTALTGLIGLSLGGFVLGLGVLIVIRFFFGVGEAGAYPNITRALHNWFPYHERAMAQGTVWMAGRLMGGLTPLVWLLLVEGIGEKQTVESGETVTTWIVPPSIDWRWAFGLFGALGVGWCVLFSLWFRNWPREKSTVNSAELHLIEGDGPKEKEAAHAGVPWLRLLTSFNLWALCLMYFCAAYAWYFNITYLPSFLQEQYSVDKQSFIGALYKGGPLWMGAITCLIGGWLSDRFIRRTGNRKWGRRMFGVIGHSLCALCLVACLFAPNLFSFFLAISLAAFWNDLTMGSAWAVCQDIGKRYAAIVAGCMNTVGNLGGAAAGWITGLILQHTLAAHAAAHGSTVEALSGPEKAAGLLPGYQISFVVFAVVAVVAVLFWLRVDATKPIVPEAVSEPLPEPTGPVPTEPPPPL